MNKAQLLKLLADAEDNEEILLEGPDHSYVRTYIEYVTYLEHPVTKDLTPDFGEALTPSSEYGTRKYGIKIVRI